MLMFSSQPSLLKDLGALIRKLIGMISNSNFLGSVTGSLIDCSGCFQMLRCSTKNGRYLLMSVNSLLLCNLFEWEREIYSKEEAN